MASDSPLDVSGAGALGVAAAAVSAAAAGCPFSAVFDAAEAADRWLVDFFLPLEVPTPSATNASFNRRTTGASTVEDAERTNSPISWSLAMTALLSIPSSLASS